jgi:predicted nucleotidyltransferase
VTVTPEDLARTLVRRHAKAREQARSRAEGLRGVLLREVRDEIARGRLRRAWLVGSLAWGGFDLASDVDLVVEGVAEEDAAALWDRLSTELGARVDLLRLESLSASFARRVHDEGEPLHVP